MQHDLGHDVTYSDLELRSKLGLDFPRSTFIYFDAHRQEEHGGVRIITLASLVQKLLAKSQFCPLTLDDLW